MNCEENSSGHINWGTTHGGVTKPLKLSAPWEEQEHGGPWHFCAAPQKNPYEWAREGQNRMHKGCIKWKVYLNPTKLCISSKSDDKYEKNDFVNLINMWKDKCK